PDRASPPWRDSSVSKSSAGRPDCRIEGSLVSGRVFKHQRHTRKASGEAMSRVAVVTMWVATSEIQSAGLNRRSRRVTSVRWFALGFYSQGGIPLGGLAVRHGMVRRSVSQQVQDAPTKVCHFRQPPNQRHYFGRACFGGGFNKRWFRTGQSTSGYHVDGASNG